MDLTRDHCAVCGKSVVREPEDSDPTWPEPVENPAIIGTPLAGANRKERLERIVRELDVTVRRAGPTLQVTLLLRRGSPLPELPIELGVSLLDAQGHHSGPPDAFVRLEALQEPVLCSIPARGSRTGDPATLAFNLGDAQTELPTQVR
ncbi:MAG: hypothetical protein HS104_28930 [Polyangiaceae bacterium]|nr:hypothetical protein [Polyangiaceae bacterium]MBK9000913.1 hypothetical protein [Myxococcales bacterium]MCE7889500.1 hypothetical protein [Sorangiineae bacterium PRO1]MCL4755801.1 hypothetical protein [Myxococcales bacterium]